MTRVVIVGRGRVGRGLAAAARGVLDVRLVASVKAPAAVGRAELVVLAVPDGAIAATSERIAPKLGRGAVVVHCAGARGVEELSACADEGAPVGAMHPLVSFAVPGKAPSLAGTTFVVSGGRRVVTACRAFARAVDARVVVADVHGPAYHGAAALVANGAAALATAGVDILTRAGLAGRAAARALGALLRTVADNVENIGVPAALTGPVRRGDAETVRGHRRALQKLGGGGRRAYDAIAPLILDCARRAGLSASAVRRVRRALAD